MPVACQNNLENYQPFDFLRSYLFTKSVDDDKTWTITLVFFHPNTKDSELHVLLTPCRCSTFIAVLEVIAATRCILA